MEVLYKVVDENKVIVGEVVKSNDGYTITKNGFVNNYKTLEDVFEYAKGNKIYLLTPLER